MRGWAGWRAVRLLGPLLAVSAFVGGTLAPVAAQTAPSVGEMFDDLTAVRAELDTAHAQLLATRDQQAVLTVEITGVGEQIGVLRDGIAVTQTRIDELVAERDEVRRLVRARAATLYRQGRSRTTPLQALELSTPMDLARRQVLGRAAARRDEELRAALQEASDELAAARDRLAAERSLLEGREADLTARKRRLDDLDARIRAQQAELDLRARDLQDRIQAAIAAGVLQAGGPSLMGPSTLTAAQMAAWWRSAGYAGYGVSVPIETLAQLYLDEGTAEGVRGDLAFAQAVVETGGFRYTAPGNNFAGMGWCDRCATGRRFPTPLDGVRAQIQHLKNYGDPTSRAANLAHPPSPYWYAAASLSPEVAATNFDAFFAKGWALTWNQMGAGNWATDPGYARKVLDVYGRMVAFATG